MSTTLDTLIARLAAKQIALAESDAAVNALGGLIAAAVNGEAEAESGARLSMADATKASAEIRQVHTLISTEIDDIERRIKKEKSRIDFAASPLGQRWGIEP